MNSVSILLVDDSDVMSALLQSILEGLGHRIVGIARDGQEAINAYRTLKPDLVTMDIAMPGIDGLQAMQSIVAEYPEARIVVVSSDSEDKSLLAALKAGAKGYILKPFDAENVAEVVRKITRKRD